jgi:hypothetical protein
MPDLVCACNLVDSNSALADCNIGDGIGSMLLVPCEAIALVYLVVPLFGTPDV